MSLKGTVIFSFIFDTASFGWVQKYIFFGHYIFKVIITTPTRKYTKCRKLAQIFVRKYCTPLSFYCFFLMWDYYDPRPKKYCCTHYRRLYSVSKMILSVWVPLSVTGVHSLTETGTSWMVTWVPRATGTVDTHYNCPSLQMEDEGVSRSDRCNRLRTETIIT